MSVHEFYRLKALTTLEQENTTEWSKKIRIISKTAMVGCCKLSLYANESCDEHGFYFFFSAMIKMTCHVNHLFDLWQWCNFSGIETLAFRVFIHTKSPQPQTYFWSSLTRLLTQFRNKWKVSSSKIMFLVELIALSFLHLISKEARLMPLLARSCFITKERVVLTSRSVCHGKAIEDHWTHWLPENSEVVKRRGHTCDWWPL